MSDFDKAAARELADAAFFGDQAGQTVEALQTALAAALDALDAAEQKLHFGDDGAAFRIIVDLERENAELRKESS